MNLPMTWLGGAAIVIVLFCVFWGYRRGFVKELISTLSLVLIIGLVWVINPYVNTFLRDHTGLFQTASDLTHDFVEGHASKSTAIGSSEQAGILDQLNLPKVLTEALEDNNKAAVYEKLGVNTFIDYVSDSLAEILFNGVSFLLSFLLAGILIKALTYILNLFTLIPGVHGINKMAGAILGGAKSVVFLWVGMVVLTILCSTPVGEEAMRLVKIDPLLSFLYNNNPIAQYFTGLLYLLG